MPDSRAVAVLAAVLAVAVWPARPSHAQSSAAPSAPPAATTPLPYPAGAIVPGTVAGAPWGPADLASLHADLTALLAGAPALRGAHVGVRAVDAASGTVLFTTNGQDEFQPASTTKLVVGSAALDRLGPDHRERTSLESIDESDGSTSLLLRTGGDPLLGADDLKAAAIAARRAGLHDVATVRVDDSRYAAPRYPDGWVWDDFGQDYAARAAAASVEENVVHLHVRPGDDAGAPAIVSAESGVHVDDTRTDDCTDALTLGTLIVHNHVTTGAASSERDVDVALDRGGCPSVFGTIPAGGAMHSIDVAVESPLVYTYGVLLDELAIAGVAAPEPAAPDAAPGVASGRYGDRRLREVRALAGTTLWQHDSPPLAAVLGPNLWIPSDNFVAEMLLEELGAVAGGAPGSTGKGLAYERTWLASLGVDLSTVTLVDGSGLSQYDRLTPSAIVTILQHDFAGAHRDVVLRSLPIGGVRGTIESLTGTPLTGRIFAKTGNMSHVHGLAGYLSTLHHGTVTFAFMVDDCNPPYAEVSALRARALSRIVTAQ